MEAKGISKVAKNLGGAISKNSPTILTGLAVGGLITTVIFAVKATPKAILLLEEEKERRRLDSDEERIYYGPGEPITRLDVVRITWKCYVPTAAIGLASIACIIGSNHINLRRTAAIASVYSITEAAFKEYQSKVTETIGKSKELKIRDEISADRIKANPPSANEVIFTGKGDVLCYDSLSGRYFKSDIEHIRRCINTLNKEFLSEMFLTLNELYFVLGLSGTSLGDQMGWDIDNGLLEINYSSQLTETGEPCLVLNYEVEPRFLRGF